MRAFTIVSMIALVASSSAMSVERRQFGAPAAPAVPAAPAPAAAAPAMAAPPAPVHGSGMTGEQAAQQCGNGQQISCCNQNNVDKDGEGLLGGDVAGHALGGSCAPLPLNLLQVPLSDSCGNNEAMCCSGDQTGLVNVQCTPIDLA